MDKLIIARDSDKYLACAKHPEMMANSQAGDAITWLGDWHRQEYRAFAPARLIASEVETREIDISRALGDARICGVYESFRDALRTPARSKLILDAISNRAAFNDFVDNLQLGGLAEG